jgi:hypothetical protein
MGEMANSKGCYMSAEDCVKVTASSFKMAIEKLLKKGPLNIQLGFTMTSSNSVINSRNQQMSIVHEVPLQTPNGKVLGFVWLVKGSISLHWQRNYWKRVDSLLFANYPGSGQRVIRIAAEQLHNVFLLG